MKQRRVQERKWLKFAIVAFGLLIAATAISYYWFSESSMPTPKRNKRANTGQFGALPDTGKVNILVLGVDHRKEDIGRSDTLFLITLDTKTKETALLSIPRDTRVKIPGYGFDKVNHAYALGGHQLTQKAVEELLGTPIDYYVEVDFLGFNKIVDAVGGVDIAVEKRMYYEDPYDDLIIDLQPGMQHMDGDTAIKYVRYRDEEGDIGRIDRQQHFIRAMMDEVTSPAILVKLPAIISQVKNAIRTDLSVTEMIGMGKALKDAKEQGLKTDMAPGTPIDIAGISYLAPDIVALREHMAKVLGIKPDAQYTSSANRLAAEYQNSLPDETVLSDKPVSTKSSLAKPGQPKSATTPVKPAVPQKPASQARPAAPQSGLIRVDIINASGNASAGEKMASQLKQQGFSVTQVSTSGNVNRNTIVIAHSAQESILNRLTGLPFNYALQVSPQAGSETQVTVVVGKDYVLGR
jgi:LCP family protein required for cell wall assembly